MVGEENMIPDFAALVTTQWHSAGVKACLNSYPDLGTGIVYVVPAANGEYQIGPADFRKWPNIGVEQIDEPHVEFRDIISLFKNISGSNTQEITILSTREISVGFTAMVIDQYDCGINSIILYDEGFGTYLSDREFLQNLRNIQGTSGVYPVLQKITEERVALALRKLIGLCTDTKTHFLFEQANGVLQPNPSIVDSYQDVFKRSRPQGEENSILFLTQPFVSDFDICEEIVLEPISRVAHSSSRHLYIKPHPREDAKKYRNVLKRNPNVELFPEEVSAEEAFKKWSFEATLGYTTTSLLTSKVLFNIPSYSLIDYIDPDLLPDPLKINFDRFSQLTSEIVEDASEFDTL